MIVRFIKQSCRYAIDLNYICEDYLVKHKLPDGSMTVKTTKSHAKKIFKELIRYANPWDAEKAGEFIKDNNSELYKLWEELK